MPDLLEHMYSAQQINIPPNLPFILKQYAKAAIRTQPYDLLFWSAAYFRAKADNLPPPVKERLEYPPFDSPSRLSPGFLRVLHKQLGENEYVRVEILYEKWLGVCLVKEALDSMLRIQQVHSRVHWMKFVAIAAGHICKSLSKTMVLICEILTDQPDGGAAWIPVETFVELYQYLAHLDCGPQPAKKLSVVLESCSEISSAPSNTTAAVSMGERKDEEEKEAVEKDSQAGLMVWPDIQPEVKPDRVQTPKYKDELGASSEVGLEMLDNSKKPVVEVVTLYPAPDKTETKLETRTLTIPPEKTKTKLQRTMSDDESIISHSSLQENEKWIKIKPIDFQEAVLKTEPSDDPDKTHLTSIRTKDDAEEIPDVDYVQTLSSSKELGSHQSAPDENHTQDEEESRHSVEQDITQKFREGNQITSQEENQSAGETSVHVQGSEYKAESILKHGTILKQESFQTNVSLQKQDSIKKQDSIQKQDSVQTPESLQKQDSIHTKESEHPKGKVESDNLDTESKAKSTILKKVEISDKKSEKVSEEEGKAVTDEESEQNKAETMDEDEFHEKSMGSILPQGVKESVDSEFQLNEAITIANIAKGRTPSYSVVEIRKGRYGDRSLDKIDAEGVLLPTDTVQNVGAQYSESGSSEDKESADITHAEEAESRYWGYVPGIGPVIPEPQILAVVEYMQYWANKQEGLVGPRNINHLLCPPLDLPPPEDQSDDVSIY